MELEEKCVVQEYPVLSFVFAVLPWRIGDFACEWFCTWQAAASSSIVDVSSCLRHYGL